MNKITTEISGVLFDLDGTLLDTANDLGAALNFVLRKHHRPEVARELYRPVASDGALGLLTLGFGEEIEAFDYEQLRAEFLDYYQANIAVHTCFYPQVEQLLATLDNNNIPWGVVTNKPEQLTLLLLPHFSAFNSCLSVVGGDTLTERKPHPAPIFHACQQLSIDSSNCCYVGDALRDIQAGNNASAKTVIAKWGYILASENCNDWQADHHAEQPLDILSFI